VPGETKNSAQDSSNVYLLFGVDPSLDHRAIREVVVEAKTGIGGVVDDPGFEVGEILIMTSFHKLLVK
jgi:hypothetical protein